MPTFIHIAWAYFACVAQLLCVGIIQLNSYWLLIVLIVVQQILLLYFEHDNLWFVYRSWYFRYIDDLHKCVIHNSVNHFTTSNGHSSAAAGHSVYRELALWLCGHAFRLSRFSEQVIELVGSKCSTLASHHRIPTKSPAIIPSVAMASSALLVKKYGEKQN